MAPHARPPSSQVTQAYRQAAQLFLTRRLPEALSTIEPVILPPAQPLLEHAVDGHGSDGEHETDVEAPPAFAPVAFAPRSARVKVWCFYFTLMNSIVELGVEEGKLAFGSARWKTLVSKCRDGSVWEDVVRDGYAGVEGDVDADIVYNLALLLLTHSSSQRLNQHRVETYLSATANPAFIVSSHMRPNQQLPNTPGHIEGSGTYAPRGLLSRIKLLEVYALHILPRNDEWVEAREFIGMSDLFDDEHKERLFIELHTLKEEKDESHARQTRLHQQQQKQAEQRRRQAEAEANQPEQPAGLEDARRRDRPQEKERRPRRQLHSADNSTSKIHPDKLSASSSLPSYSTHSTRNPPRSPLSLFNRASSLLALMHVLFSNAVYSLSANPLKLFRTLLFISAFSLAFGRRDLRERVRYILQAAWEKVRRTLGMGLKLSYV